MIEVRDLVRRYGETEAVSHVSFSVAKGDIVGFLGPNGAGKTTTLRMITGFLPPTSGEVMIEGLNASENTKVVKRLIGYLPENNPLYEDQRVREYLTFRAELKGIKRAKRSARIEEVMVTCDVVSVAHKLIGACSRGYRQRVGMADALLAAPPVLILDEPTVGLDPGQIVHVRNLIKSLSRNHTVILSTHILPEVEAICSRALILHKGKLLFEGSVEGLRESLGGGGQLLCSLDAPRKKAEACLAAVPEIAEIVYAGEAGGSPRFEVKAKEGQDPRRSIFAACAGENLPILEMTPRHVSLEEAFLSITTSEEAREEVQ